MDSYKTIFEKNAKHVSDKFSLYLEIYNSYFDSKRTEIRKLLEIGVQNGGSLDIWAEYLPKAQSIVGVDIDQRCSGLRFDDSRIHVEIGDATTKKFVETLKAKYQNFNLIVDDGSHINSDVISTFKLLFPILAPGGDYVIEDLHSSFWPTFGGGLNSPTSSYGFIFELANYVNSQSIPSEHKKEWSFLEENKEYLSSFDEIKGIQIFDSLAIITKQSKNQISRLGPRAISGVEATVEKTVPVLDGENLWIPPQPPYREISKYDSSFLADLVKENFDLRRSMSWKITKPFRALSNLVTKSRR